MTVTTDVSPKSLCIGLLHELSRDDVVDVLHAASIRLQGFERTAAERAEADPEPEVPA